MEYHGVGHADTGTECYAKQACVLRECNQLHTVFAKRHVLGAASSVGWSGIHIGGYDTDPSTYPYDMGFRRDYITGQFQGYLGVVIVHEAFHHLYGTNEYGVNSATEAESCIDW